jgi:hypothetical protein
LYVIYDSGSARLFRLLAFFHRCGWHGDVVCFEDLLSV